MPMHHRMTREDDDGQVASNPRRYDDAPMSFNDLVGELKDLMNQDRASQLAKGKKAQGCWFGEAVTPPASMVAAATPGMMGPLSKQISPLLDQAVLKMNPQQQPAFKNLMAQVKAMLTGI